VHNTISPPLKRIQNENRVRNLMRACYRSRFLQIQSDFLQPGIELLNAGVSRSHCCSYFDPPRKTLPQEARDFGPRGSVCVRLARTIAVNITQVMISSKSVETEAQVRPTSNLPQRAGCIKARKY
jgi:hypothetical protein